MNLNNSRVPGNVELPGAVRARGDTRGFRAWSGAGLRYPSIRMITREMSSLKVLVPV
jgi:hypothetical protein